MRRRKFKVVTLMAVLVLAVALLLPGCGGQSSQGGTDSNEDADSKLKIGVSICTQREERWVRDKLTIEEEAEKAGIELAIQIADNDAATQQSQCENLLSQGIDVLILAPVDSKASARIVNMAHEAGVKAISYDKLVLDSEVDLYISFDNVKVGEIQGEWLTKNVPNGNIVVLSGDPLDNNAKLFKQGAMNMIQPKVDRGDYTIVFDQACKDWQPGEAMKHMENALTANKNDIQGVLAPNDGTAGGCIQALAAQNLAGKIPITGQDAELAAAKRIVEGTQGMTVFKDTRELGKAAVEAAIKMAKGEDPGANGLVNNDKIDVQSILLTPVAVDKESLDKVLIDSGYLAREDVYGSN